MRLFHYTCDHGAAAVERDGLVVPSPLRSPASTPSGVDGAALVWLTDRATPSADALGLTSLIVDCDRTRWRVSVHAPAAVPWLEWADRHRVRALYRMLLTARGGEWRRWWVSEEPAVVLAVERSQEAVPA